MKTRIGYYDDTKVSGGTTRYLFDLLDGLDRDEFDPIFFAPANYAWHETLRRIGVKVVTPSNAGPAGNVLSFEAVKSPTLTKPRFRLPRPLAWHLGLGGELKQAYRLFRSESVDLFHSNNIGPEAAPIAAHWVGKPVVGTLHVDPTYDLSGARGSWRYRNLEKWCFRSVDYAIAGSRSTANLWSSRCCLSDEYRSVRMSVIHLGIEAKRLVRRQTSQAAKQQLNIPSDALVIASLGRLEPAKGYEYLIRALPAIVESVPQVRVIIGGQGFLKEELVKLAESLGVSGRLHFPGFIGDVRDILEAADIYVQPSVCEALGYGLLESQTLGLPAVVSGVGGMPEIVESGVNGVIVPPRNPQALASALAALAHDPSRRVFFGAAGRERVERLFPMEEMHNKTFELYRQLTTPKQNHVYRAGNSARRSNSKESCKSQLPAAD